VSNILCLIVIPIATIVVGTFLYLLPELIGLWLQARQHRATVKEIQRLRKEVEHLHHSAWMEVKHD